MEFNMIKPEHNYHNFADIFKCIVFDGEFPNFILT